jgi:hypothetical protein
VSRKLMLTKWDDAHQDGIEACIETDPVEWFDEDGNDLSEPVVYVSGDAYLTSAQARELARHLNALAANLDVAAARKEQPDA